MMDSDNLCHQCVDIDLEQVFRGGYETPQEVRNLGFVPKSQLSSSCPLCRLVAEAIYRPFCDASLSSYHHTCNQCDLANVNEDADSSTYHLLAVQLTHETASQSMGHSTKVRYRDWFLQTEQIQRDVSFSKAMPKDPQLPIEQLEDGVFIALRVGQSTSPESSTIAFYGSIYLASGATPPARLLSYPGVDWNLLRGFLTECQERHIQCSLPTEELEIRNFLLLDCEKRKLVQAGAGDEYVALSYVWGEPDRNADITKLAVGSTLPEAAPVIEDAMRAVVELGYKYLWVDRYCIPQNEPGALADHLSKMHLVYQYASFTIVAAAGIDSSFGLPGVSSRPREAQTHAWVDGHLLASGVEPFPPSRQCKWASRAWTYQEGFFATRQLIFGPHQVSYHCIQSKQSEIFTFPVSSSTEAAISSGASTRSIWEHVEHYSQRSLTYESDALNALMATLNSFDGGAQRKVANLWGIPFSEHIDPLNQIGPSAGTGRTGLLSSASFASATAIFGHGLSWRMSATTPEELTTLRRRKDFPTWSWASCVGHIVFPRLPWLVEENMVMPDPELEVAAESVDGRLIPLSTYLTNHANLDISQYLHIEGWSVRDALNFHLRQGTVSLDLGDSKYELTGSIQFDTFPNGKTHKDIFNILSERKNSKKLWEALIMWFSPQDDSNAIRPFLVIMIKVEDSKHPNRDVYERVGNVPSLRLERMPKKRRERRRDSKGLLRKGPRMTVKWAADMLHGAGFIPYDATLNEAENLRALEDEGDESDESGDLSDESGDLSNEGGDISDDSPGDERDSDDSDSSDMCDYTINMVMARSRAKKYFPRIPMVRRKFILR